MTIAPNPPDTVSWSCPDATFVLRADAPREQWLAERRRGLGGSDASSVSGLNSRYGSRYKLWCDKTGRLDEILVNRAMRMGQLLEPVLLTLFQEETGLAVQRRGLMRNRRRPHMQVTVDALSGDGGVVECKTTNWRTDDAPIWRAGDVPDHAEVQTQWALAVTGRSHAYACALIDSSDFRLVRIPRNETVIDRLTQLADEFWFEHVLPDVAPELDDSEATYDAVRDRWRDGEEGSKVAAGPEVLALRQEWMAAGAEKKAAEAREKAIEAELAELIGEHELLTVEGKEVLTRKQNGSFSEKRFREMYPHLAAEYRRQISVLDLPRIKEEHPGPYRSCRARVLRAVKSK